MGRTVFRLRRGVSLDRQQREHHGGVGRVVGIIEADRFDRRIRLEFHGATITSDAGLLACRELDDALGLTEAASDCLQESRGGHNVQHRLVGLLRQSVYSRLAGYEDTNDAERLADDPTMRVIVGRRGGPERPAASTNTMGRFETEVLTQDGNVRGLGRVNAKWVDGAMSRAAHRRVTLADYDAPISFGLPLEPEDSQYGKSRFRSQTTAKCSTDRLPTIILWTIHSGSRRKGIASMFTGLCVINMKGGVGKTTVAVNLALEAADRGLRTLLVDLDPQFNSSVYLMGERAYERYMKSGGLTVFDIFEQHSPLRDPQKPNPSADTVIYRTIGRYWATGEDTGWVHIVPSQLELASTLKNPAGKAHLVSSFLQQHATDYDFVIVDPPPTDSMATDAAYLATNHVLVPVRPEFLSSIGFPLLARSVTSFRNQYPDHPLEVVGVFLDNVSNKGNPKEYRLTKEATQRFADAQGWRFLDHELRHSRSYVRSSREGTPISRTPHANYHVKGEFRRFADDVFDSMELLG